MAPMRVSCVFVLVAATTQGVRLPQVRRCAASRPAHARVHVVAAASRAGPARTSGRAEYTAVLLVPTGIGASIGGYAGDALPVARALASVVDVLVTHPNVLNGAMLYWPPPNALYVEGWALDEFGAGRLGLRPVRRNRIGLVLDAAIEPELRDRHLQAADAARATLGLDVGAWTLTDQPVGVGLATQKTGASWGTLGAPEALVRAGRRLVDEHGCTALALVCRLPDSQPDSAETQAYRAGAGVDAVGGVEALISRFVARRLRLPCAHAPALAALPLDLSVSPRAAAEELGYTFLPCVLANLHRAPALSEQRRRPAADDWSGEDGPGGGDDDGSVWARDVDVVIAPAGACGGAALLALCAREHVLLVAVEENESVMSATPQALQLGAGAGGAARAGSRAGSGGAQVIMASTYLEAVGIVAAHRAGISLDALTARGVSALCGAKGKINQT